ncbi:unnamed protein product [Moneuplotes crassus]|uniref:Uncharacterized protein n=1 Tax=Euplotes crassus TaxID=5936 RepID=A0AAD1UJ50_EUPCR|nr:unnamed protein product [Moneuplotes crassus]
MHLNESPSKINDHDKEDIPSSALDKGAGEKRKIQCIQVHLPKHLVSQQNKGNTEKLIQISSATKNLKVYRSTNNKEIVKLARQGSTKKSNSKHMVKKFTLTESKKYPGTNEKLGTSSNRSISAVFHMNKKYNSRNVSQYFKSTTNDNTEVNLPILEKIEQNSNPKKFMSMKVLKKNKNATVIKSKKRLTSLKDRIQQLYDKYYDPIEKTPTKNHLPNCEEGLSSTVSPVRCQSRNSNVSKFASLPPLSTELRFCTPTNGRCSSLAKRFHQDKKSSSSKSGILSRFNNRLT